MKNVKPYITYQNEVTKINHDVIPFNQNMTNGQLFW